MKISLDTNILIDTPEIVLNKTKDFVVSFKVIQELDNLKRNPDLKRAAQSALKNLRHMYYQDKLSVVGVPPIIGDTPDEIIINDTRKAGAAFLTNDFSAELIAALYGVEVSGFETESAIDTEYTGYVTVKGTINYEQDFVQIKEMQLLEFNEQFGTDLKENMYCIIDRVVDKNDIWLNKQGVVKRLSQSHGPYKDAGVLITPLDSEQFCAMHAVFDNDVPLTVIDGPIGCGKTVLTLMAALARTCGRKNQKIYEQILVSKPPVSTNKDLYTGYKPGPQPLHSKILTPDGWSTMGKMKIGSIVMGRDGKPTKVTGVYPKGKKEVFRITTNTGKEVLACEDHLWLTQDHNEFKHSKSGTVRTTAEIKETLTYKDSGKLSHHLPRRAPMEFGTYEKLPLDPYVLGCLLGDGYIGMSSTPRISSVDIEIVQEINDRLKKINAKILGCSGIDYTLGADDGRPNKPKGPNLQGRFTNPVKEALSTLGLLGKHFDTKFIPDTYIFNASIQDRLDLLRGLMDTDGTVNKDGKAVFYTSGIPLRDSVIQLVLSLGGSTSTYTRNREDYVSLIDSREIRPTCDCHEVSLTLPDEMIPFLLPRKVSLFNSRRASRRKSNVTTDIIAKIESYSYEEVQCISVDNEEHLYITDDYIVTHNTTTQKMSGHLGGIKSNLKFLLDKRGEKPKINQEGELIETTSGKIWEEYFGIIEIDEVQGTSMHDTLWIVDEWQLLDEDAAKLVMSRLASGSKVVLVGDTSGQTYGMNRASEGFKPLFKWFGKVPEFSYIKLENIYRSPLAEFVAKVYE